MLACFLKSGDTKGERFVGNFPQAFSHITLAHAAYTLAGMWRPGIGVFPPKG